MRDDVELSGRAVPERIRLGPGAVVQGRSGVNPGLGGRIEPVDVVGQSDRVEKAAPPGPVVPPQFALGPLAGELGVPGRAVGKVAIADVLGVREGRAQSVEKKGHERASQRCSRNANLNPQLP